MKGLKSFDFYRTVPRELTEPTVSGAAVSFCTALLALFLFSMELSSYLRPSWKSEMLIDKSLTEEKLQINLDITLPAMPCELLSFDAQDMMGSHEVDVHGNLYKTRLTSKGDIIGREEMSPSHYGASSQLTRHHSFSYDNSDVDRISRMVNSGEGCRVSGFVKVNMVPGNVHLSTYSHSYMFGSLYKDTRNINASHTINHVSFGPDADILYATQNLLGLGAIAPLDGLNARLGERESTVGFGGIRGPPGGVESAIFEYYTKIVPTRYEPLNRQPLNIFQFTASSNRIANQQMPSLYLRYDISPVTVKYVQSWKSFSHFLVEICAVVGGMFTVAGLLDSALHKGIVNIAKKAQLGKIG